MELEITLNFDGGVKTETLEKVGSLLTEYAKNTSLFIIPVVIDDLSQFGINTKIKVKGGIFNIKRYLANIMFKLEDVVYKKLGRDAYIKKFNLEVP